MGGSEGGSEGGSYFRISWEMSTCFRKKRLGFLCPDCCCSITSMLSTRRGSLTSRGFSEGHAFLMPLSSVISASCGASEKLKMKMRFLFATKALKLKFNSLNDKYPER